MTTIVAIDAGTDSSGVALYIDKELLAMAKMAQNVGMVKATAQHIFAFLDRHNKEVIKIKPRPGNWGTIAPAHGKRALQQRTGGTGQSNKDTRSAAFFGWIVANWHQ